MKKVRIYRPKDNLVFADPCLVADSLWSRFIGLMGKPSLDSGAGLLLEPCSSIHTFFMKFDIDAVYLSLGASAHEYKVVAIRRAMRPWRMDFPVFGARAVLELPSGGAKSLAEGDLLCLS